MSERVPSDNSHGKPVASQEQRRLIVIVVVRASLIAIAEVALFFILPLRAFARLPILFVLAAGVLILVAVSLFQVRKIARSPIPGVHGVEAVAFILPLFLVLFACAYAVLSIADPANFTTRLTRLDALYFTVTVFSTVGFGDIAPKSQLARGIVTSQIVLDLVLLGVLIKVIASAVRIAREGRRESDALSGRSSEGNR